MQGQNRREDGRAEAPRGGGGARRGFSLGFGPLGVDPAPGGHNFRSKFTRLLAECARSKRSVEEPRGVVRMSKQIVYHSKARKEMKLGLDALANVVKVTLGPGGRCVAYEKSWGAPGVTKDGVTVAKEIELSGKFQNMGCEMVREVASRTNDDTGDGTTTATVLAQAIYGEGVKLIEAGF